jgi:hypothetical protein
VNALSTPTITTGEDALSAYRLRALAHVKAASADLDGIARRTDSPDWRDVDAADLLAAAADLLARSTPP